MSTIGIYGDSFAGSHNESVHFSWYELLANKLNTSVFNYENNTDNTYGSPATSTFFSYKKFIEYSNMHEYNIFIASDAGKYTKFVDIFREKGPVAIPGINSLEWYLDDPDLRADAKDQLGRIRSWLLVSDDEYMQTAQELMLQNMERKLGKNLVILASDIHSTFCPERKQNSCINFGLWDLANLMYEEMGITDETRPYVLNERTDKISCHLSEEANHVLADLLYTHIKTGEKMTLPKRIPHEYPWQHYFY